MKYDREILEHACFEFGRVDLMLCIQSQTVKRGAFNEELIEVWPPCHLPIRSDRVIVTCGCTTTHGGLRMQAAWEKR